MLKITNLHVSSADTPILKSFNLMVEPGKVHALMGPNGSGKSTLAYTLMGHPGYTVTQGSVAINGTSLLDLTPDKRAKLGLFLAFQHPYAIEGVQVATFLREALNATRGDTISTTDFTTLLFATMTQLGIDHSFAYRSLHDGFSGGERKRLELLQMVMLNPCLAILDEIDSGLDIDALKAVAAGIEQVRRANPATSFLVITHYQRLLTYVQPDYVHIMRDGAVITSGNADLVAQLEAKGYDAII